VLDHLVHGANHQSDPELLLFPPLYLMDELVLRHFSSKDHAQLRYFFAGGGAYSLPRRIKAVTPAAEITVVELDPRVTETAVQSLFVDTSGMSIIHADARTVLQHNEHDRYDVIVLDAFHDLSVPYHLSTREYIQLVKSRLNPGGLYLLHVADVFPDPHLIKSMMKTLRTQFRHVDAWIDRVPTKIARMTFVLSATDLKPPADMNRVTQGIDRTWYRVTEPLLATGVPSSELPELTDDYVPVERLISPLLFGQYGL